METPDEEILEGELLEDSTRPEPLPAGLLAQMRADPGHAPEYLAVAAVGTFGPEAARWVGKFRAEYPHVSQANLALLVRTRFIRLSQASGAAAGVIGAVGAIFDTGVLAWNQARMVLYLAAVYGHDPTDPERAAEFLVIRGIQDKLDAARTAIDVARRRQDARALLKHVPPTRGGLPLLAWELARMGGMVAVKKTAMRFIPLAAVPIGALANASSTAKLANKTMAFYATRPPRPMWVQSQRQLP